MTDDQFSVDCSIRYVDLRLLLYFENTKVVVVVVVVVVRWW
jgi:hypothetical protein